MKQVVVIGLGRFGRSIARSLYDMGVQVMVIDNNSHKIKAFAPFVTRAIECDATSETALRAAGIRNFDVGIVSVGTVQDSIMITLLLKEQEVPLVIARANDGLHAKILTKIGADKVITPERDMGKKLAYSLMSSNILEYIEVAKDVGLLEMAPSDTMIGKTLQELDIRNRYGVNIIALKEGESINISPSAEDVINKSNILVLLGSNQNLKRIREI